MPGANDKPRRRSTFPPRWAAALLFYTGRLGSAHSPRSAAQARLHWPPRVDRSGAAHTELHNMRPLMTMIDTPTERAESAIGAPRPGQPQDWRHRIMPKGFVSERDLDPRAHDLRICVTSGSWRRIIAGQRNGSSVRRAS